MSHTVVGLFNNRNAAQTAKQELIQKGFTAENIDVSHRAAKLYKFDQTIYNKLTEKGFNFEF